MGCLCLDNPTPFGTLSPARPAGLFFVEPIPALGIVLAAEDQRPSFRNVFLAPLRRGFSSENRGRTFSKDATVAAITIELANAKRLVGESGLSVRGRNGLTVEVPIGWAPPGVGWARHARGARHSVFLRS